MITTYFLAIILTICIESILGYILGYKRAFHFLCFVLINILTNSLLNLSLMNLYTTGFYSDLVLIILELLVVIIEMIFYHILFGIKYAEAFRLSIILNFFSFIAGYLIYK